MKVSYSWLKELVDFDITPQQLAEDLSMLGIVAETVEPVGNDYVLDLDVTTNRPDCLSHVGVARELAARYVKPLRLPDCLARESVRRAEAEVSVRIASPMFCARYCARVIKGVKVAPSPSWLAQRLEDLGIRTINNVVDATNYALLELGHPLHAFDLSRIEGRQIIVREAGPGETLVTLDGESRELAAGMLVISDRDRPVALAGIMGGADGEIGFSSTDVLLESAWFEPNSIRGTSKALGMHTEASHRFERGADVIAARLAIDRAAALILQLAGGELLAGVVDVYPKPVERPVILLRRSRITAVMGARIEDAFVERLLPALNFQVLSSSDNGWQVQSASSRMDVTSEIDLIEEIARHYGYDRFASTLPAWSGSGRQHPDAGKESTLKQRLVGLGYSETVTYSFISAAENRRFSDHDPVRLRNPLSSEAEVMRTSLVPGLLASVLRNYNRGMKSSRLYELGRLYLQAAKLEECEFKVAAEAAHPDVAADISKESLCLGLIATGDAQEKTVHMVAQPWSFFALKGDLEVLLDSLALPLHLVGWRSPHGGGKVPGYYHPGVASELTFEETFMGVLGQLHPKVCEAYKIKQPVFLAEIPLDAWYRAVPCGRAVQELVRFPAVQRDLSIVVDQEINYEAIESTIRTAGIAEVQRCFPFDLYFGERVPAGKKGLSISIVYQSASGTLVEEEVNRCHQTILNLLETKLGAQLRT